MIFVDRSREPLPAVLDHTDPASLGAKETALAIAYAVAYASALKADPTADPHKHLKKPTFAAYKHDTVKEALINLFHGKCAYCETDTNASGARDIEHFRPKGRIDPGTGEETITPGYYWLAANWDNLVLACPACNRSQRQLQRDAAGRYIFETKATGKLDLFPISNQRYRVRTHSQALAREEAYRLLLDPCIDQPDEHLEYDRSGNILPKRISGKLSAKALRSIEVYQLKRMVLVEARKTRYLNLKDRWNDILFAASMIDLVAHQDGPRIAARIKTTEAEIREMLEKKQPYTGMLRYFWAPLEPELAAVKVAFEVRFGYPI